MFTSRNVWLGLVALFPSLMLEPAIAQQQQKPNVLVIMGDDMYWNISAYNRENRTYDPQNFSSPVQNDFCNTIGTFETSGDVRFCAAVGGRADVRRSSRKRRL